MRLRYLVVGLAVAGLASAGSAQARIGGTVAAFNKTLIVEKLGYKPMGSQRVVIGRWKGCTAHQYVAPDTRSFIDLVVSSKGVIVEQAMLMPIQPNAMDAARFVEFIRETTNNTKSVDMNDVFKFIHQAVQVPKDAKKQFGGYWINIYRYPPGMVVMDVKVTAASGPSAKQGAS